MGVGTRLRRTDRTHSSFWNVCFSDGLSAAETQTSSGPRRPPQVHGDLLSFTQTFSGARRPPQIQADLLRSIRTSSGPLRPSWVQADLLRSKQTSSGPRRQKAGRRFLHGSESPQPACDLLQSMLPGSSTTISGAAPHPPGLLPGPPLVGSTSGGMSTFTPRRERHRLSARWMKRRLQRS